MRNDFHPHPFCRKKRFPTTPILSQIHPLSSKPRYRGLDIVRLTPDNQPAVKRPVLQATIDYCNDEGITYDPATGEFATRGRRRRTYTDHRGTWVNIYLEDYPAHILAWAMTFGLPPSGHTVRQINNDLRDTRLANLECVPDAVASSRSARTSTGYRNVSVVQGRYRAKVQKAGRYHIRDFNNLQDAVTYVNEIKGVRKQFAGKAVVEGVTRVDTVRKDKPYTYWRACRMHHGRPNYSTFSTKEKAEEWRPITEKLEPLSPENIAFFNQIWGF